MYRNSKIIWTRYVFSGALLIQLTQLKKFIMSLITGFRFPSNASRFWLVFQNQYYFLNPSNFAYLSLDWTAVDSFIFHTVFDRFECLQNKPFIIQPDSKEHETKKKFWDPINHFWETQILTNFVIARTIYSNSERSLQFLKQNAFF